MMRQLTVAQHSRLEQIADEDHQAQVIGWRDGPIIRRWTGWLQTVNPHGRLTGLGYAKQAAV